MANYFELFCRDDECREDRVTVHHTKESVSSVAEAVIIVAVVPKDRLCQEDVPYGDR